MTLRRVLGAGDAAWLVAGNMLGAGMFLTPGLVAGRLPGLAWQIGAWLAGAALALAGAAIYAELGTRIPRAGGEYAYLAASLGRGWGFLTAWGAFVLTFSASAAAMAAVAVDHVRAVTPGWIPEGWPARVAAAGVVLALTAANAAGARVSSRTTLVLTVIPVAGLLVLFAGGALRAPDVFHLPPAPWRAPDGVPWVAFGAAMIPVFFTYAGWNAAAYVAGEIEDPGRNLPRGLLAGTAAVAALYVALAFGLAAVVPEATFRGSTTAGAEAARILLGPAAGRFLAALVAAAVLASVNVTLMAGARIYYAAAEDGLAPAALARTARTGVPHVALWTAGAWSAALALVGGIATLVSWATLAILLLSAATAVALFVVRRRSVGHAPFVCPGHPWTAAAYVAATLAVAASSVAYDPRGAAAGLAVLLAGVPVYAWIRRHGRRRAGDAGRGVR